MRAGYLISGGDNPVPELQPLVAGSHLLSAWGDHAGLGLNNAFEQPLLFPFIFFDATLAALGCSPTFINHAWIVVLFAAQGAGTLYLFDGLFPELKHSAFRLAATLVSVVNPYVLISYHTPFLFSMLAIAMTPWVVGSGLRYLRAGGAPTLALFAVTSLLSTGGDHNYGVVAVQWTLYAVVVAFGLAARRFAAVTALAALHVGIHAPLLAAGLHEAAAALPEIAERALSYGSDTLRVTSYYSALPNAVRLVGEYLFFNVVGPTPYLPEGQSYEHAPLIVVASSMAPLIAFAIPFFAAPALRGRLRLVAIIAIGALFMAKGESWPLGSAFAWLFYHFAPFQAFCDSFNKFGWVVMYGYALLFGVAIATLCGSANATSVKRGIAAVAVTGVLIAGWPILRGHLFWERVFVRIPQNYAALARALDSQPGEGARMIQLPIAPAVFDTYSWGYVGAGFLPYMIGRPLVTRAYDLISPGTAALDDALQYYRTTIGTRDLARLAGMYGVGYIDADSSIDIHFYGPGLAADALTEAPPGTQLAFRAGTVRLFRIDDSLANDRVFSPSIVFSGPADLVQTVETCRQLATCKGVADIAPASVADLGRPAPTSQAVLDKEPLLVPWAVERLPPASSGLLTFVDFANGSTLLERPSYGPFFVGMKSRPTILTFATQTAAHHGRADFLGISLLGAGRESPAVVLQGCADARLVRRVFRAAGVEGTYLLGLTYRSRLELRFCVLSERGQHDVLTASLPSSPSPYTFLRLIRLHGPIELVVVEPNARESHAQILALVLGRQSRPHPWRLLGDQIPFSATPPYVAEHRGDAEQHADEPARFVRATAAAPSSPPEILGFWDRDVPDGAAPSRVWARFGHLVPGADYDADFFYRWQGISSLKCYAVDDAGYPISSVDFGPGPNVQAAHLLLHVPENSSGFVLTLFVDTVGEKSDEVYASPPVLRLHRRFPVRVIFARVRTPKAIHATKLGSDQYAVDVQDAPRDYLVVLNDAYDPDWSLAGPRGVSAVHIVANHFMNGWIVRGAGTYRLALRFRGGFALQIGTVIGLLLSVLGLMAAIFEQRAAHARRSAVTSMT